MQRSGRLPDTPDALTSTGSPCTPWASLQSRLTDHLLVTKGGAQREALLQALATKSDLAVVPESSEEAEDSRDADDIDDCVSPEARIKRPRPQGAASGDDAEVDAVRDDWSASDPVATGQRSDKDLADYVSVCSRDQLEQLVMDLSSECVSWKERAHVAEEQLAIAQGRRVDARQRRE